MRDKLEKQMSEIEAMLVNRKQISRNRFKIWYSVPTVPAARAINLGASLPMFPNIQCSASGNKNIAFTNIGASYIDVLTALFKLTVSSPTFRTIF